MPTFPNPELHALYQRDLGDIWEAARAAGVKPGTIRVWESRGKIERVRLEGGQPLYHLPTVEAAAQVKPGRPSRAA
ncbi:MerR family DNA-binding transcriptional regulator [Streptomyces rishiriensis]|uniref:MerR family DNA-binding transcriptional regulator n=1 Tax=Streptomyces rishiriensis TaxID=68264 RepID=UPI00131EE77F|nr:MerR family DNA-binding transcriptional regulator [Streptomyces rishiriensis]